MTTDHQQPLQAWTCIKCGAALPTEVGVGKLVTCRHCGTSFKLPEAQVRHGGVNLSGGSVTVGGDVVGGSKIVASSDGARPAVTLWDDSTDTDDKGVSIDDEDVQVYGDVIGGNVVKVAPPARKLGWWEKIKRWFAN